MNNTVRAKGLDELRTATTHHIAAKPPRKGTNYLDLFALSMERQRLCQSLTGIERQRKHILDRLADIQKAMEKLMNEAQQERLTESSSVESASVPQPIKKPSGERPWKKMTVAY